METSTVCTKSTMVCIKLTETPTDQPRELANDQRSLAQFGIDIEVGKAVISTSFKSLKKNLKIVLKKYLCRKFLQIEIKLLLH